MHRIPAVIVGAFAGLALITGIVWAQVGFKASPVLQTTTTAAGQSIRFPQVNNEISALMVEIAPGGDTGRHKHPIPAFVYVLQGVITLEENGQPTRVYKAGKAFVETVDTWHNAFNKGSTPAKALVVFVGEKGRPGLVRP